MKNQSPIVSCFFLLSLALTSCGVLPEHHDPAPGAPGAGTQTSGQTSRSPGNGTAPSFATIQSEILTPHCVGCHSAASPAAGIDLSSFSGVSRAVQAGNPDASALFNAVAGGAMPLGGPALAQTQVQLIADWISAGANE